MEFYLIRHGKTEWNEQKRMQGQQDSPLVQEGLTQLALLGERLRDLTFEGFYVSPLKRTMDSAKTVFPQADFIKTPELMEIALGDWEGCHYDSVHSDEPETHEDFWRKPHLFKRRPGGGETFFDVQQRAVKLVENLREKHGPKDRIVLVSHSVVIKSILHHYSRRPMEQFWDPPFIYPASLSVLRISREIDFPLYGSISHYQEEKHTMTGLL